MSNEIRSKGKQLKAPRELIEAVKKGERLAPKRRRFDTRSTHMRRFTLALAGYACAAALLIGGAALIPALRPNNPSSASRPSRSDVATAARTQSNFSAPDASGTTGIPHSEAIVTTDRTTTEQSDSDLVWADDLDTSLQSVVLGMREQVDGEQTGDEALTLPDALEEDTEYAIEVVLESFRTETHEGALTSDFNRHDAVLEDTLHAQGILPRLWVTSDDGVCTCTSAADLSELRALDLQALLGIFDIEGNFRMTVRIASKQPNE